MINNFKLINLQVKVKKVYLIYYILSFLFYDKVYKCKILNFLNIQNKTSVFLFKLPTRLYNLFSSRQLNDLARNHLFNLRSQRDTTYKRENGSFSLNVYGYEKNVHFHGR